MSLTDARRRANQPSMPEMASPGGAPNSQQARTLTLPNSCSPAGADSRPTILAPTPDSPASDGHQLADRQGANAAHSDLAVSDQSADIHSAPDAQIEDEIGTHAGSGPAAIWHAASTAPSLLDPALALAADVLDDIERVRIANENRLRQLTRSAEDADGGMRGFGLDESHPDVARLAVMVQTLGKVEHDATLNLQRLMRRHPLGPWVKSIRGAGEKQVARLLAVIGDPYIRPETVREDGTSMPSGPRTVSALWAYSGLHVLPVGSHTLDDTHLEVASARAGGDPGQCMIDSPQPVAGVAPKRARGQRANWSSRAKTRAYLIASSCLKQLSPHCRTSQRLCGTQPTSAGPVVRHQDDCPCSPYRVVYDRRRAHTAVTHPDWSDGHSHNDALRVASKAFLRDLWREAKRIHEAAQEASC